MSLWMCFCPSCIMATPVSQSDRRVELWPLGCLEVTTESIQLKTNFCVSKLSKNRPSKLMCIVWSSVFSLNFFCSTNFSVFVQEKSHLQLAVLLLIVIIILSEIVTPLIASPL